MLRLRASLIALVAACALPAIAQETVRVESGEHADFSRLVLYYPETPDWRLARTADGYALRVAGNYSYATGGVFDLIPRERLAGLRQEDGTLWLDLACECSVDVRAYSRSILVVDVGDGPSTRVSQRPRANPRRAPAPGEQAPDRGTYAATQDDDLVARWREAMERRVRAVELDVVHEPAPAMLLPGAFRQPPPTETVGPTRLRAAAAPETAPAPNRRSARADAIAGDLLRQIGRAASQGLVEADLAETEALLNRARAGSEVQPAPEPEPHATPEPEPQPAAEPAASGSHVAIHTSMDRALREDVPATTRDGAPCLAADTLAVHTWKHEEFDGGDLAQYRAGLIDARDRVDPAGAMAFARHLVALSFGAEALAVLELVPADTPDHALLTAMADIVEHGSTGRPGPLADQLACNSSAALWALLATGALPETEAVDAAAVVAGFSALPLHLRRHLGPILGGRFLDAGEAGTAAALRNAIARAPGEHGIGFALLDARIDLETGRPDEGRRKLAELAREGRSPEALALALEQGAVAGEVDADLIAHADALSRELRGSSVAARLKRAELEALAATDAFDRALSRALRAEEGGVVDAETAAALRGSILLQVAERGSEADLLDHAFGAEHVLGATASERAARRALAQRLLGHGLTGQAGRLVNQASVVPALEDRLILAEAALADGRPDVALGYVMGVDEPRAEKMRARISEAAAGAAPAIAAESDIRDAQSETGVLERGRGLLERSSAARDELRRRLGEVARPNI